MGKKKATTEAPVQRGMTGADKLKVLRTRMQLAKLLLSKDVPDILLPDLEKLMLAGNTTLLRRTERAEGAKDEVAEFLGAETDEIEAEVEEPEPTPPPGPRRGVRR